MSDNIEIENEEIEQLSDVNPLAEIITIKEILKHPDADALELIMPDETGINFAISKLNEFKVGDKAVWIDSVNDPMVPVSNPAFSFLAKDANKNGYARIKTRRLRGINSRGLLIPMPPNFDESGEVNIVDFLKLQKYNSSNKSRTGGRITMGLMDSGPDHLLPSFRYEIESIFKNWKFLEVGQKIIATEKVHGCNGAYGFLKFRNEYKFCIRSKSTWRKEGTQSSWLEAAQNLDLKNKLQNYPNLLVYGEIYGSVQELKYGNSDSVKFIIFDVWNTNTKTWYSYDEVVTFGALIDVPVVPVVAEYIVTGDEFGKIPDVLKEAAEGMSTLPGANNIREGVVLRSTSKYGRFIYKLVGTTYLLTKK